MRPWATPNVRPTLGHTDAQPASPDDSATRSHNLAIEIVIDPPGQVRLLIKGDQISTA